MNAAVAYRVGDGLYVNLTNRCPCDCTFCLRRNGPGLHGSPALWLDREPDVDEVWAALLAEDPRRFRETVFCGYGEPTERLDVLLEIARRLKALDSAIRVRVNTNGLSDLVNGSPTAPLFAGLADCVSVSLNTDDPAKYLAMCRPCFGAAAWPAMLEFTRQVAKCVPDTVMTVVGEPVNGADVQERCRAIAEGLGARLRVRRYEPPPQAAGKGN